ncbi:MAG: hypothetical protein PVG83_12675 [Acidimicrobiia bacterium]|jgi:hypothetical protein
MSVELNGNVRMSGDTGPGIGVTVIAEPRRLKLLSGSELVGDWAVSEIGIVALQEGFGIKAEGEEFVLRTDDDVALAEEIGIHAASPRLARRLAVRHNPEEHAPAPEPVPEPVSSNVGAVGFAVAGALVAAGGSFLRSGIPGSSQEVVSPASLLGVDYWLWFVIGGGLMIASAFVMSAGIRVGRVASVVVLMGMILLFGLAVTTSENGATELSAYGFIAGGLVVGLAVMFSGALRQT